MSSSTSEEIELATQTPLPPSVSTLVFYGSDHSETLDDTIDGPSNALALNRIRGPDQALAPADGGFKAWSFLASAFLVQGIVWGFPTAFGVFLTAYLRDPAFNSQKHAASLLPLIGNLSSGIIYCSGPVIFPFTSRFPKYRRPCIWAGAILCWVSMFAASYATTVRELVALLGLLYAIGGSLVYQTSISFLPEWFIQKRGFASGVMFAGTSVGGVILPLVIPTLLDNYGISKSLRILSIAFTGLLFLTIPFIQPRIPEGRIQGPSPRGRNFSWMKNRVFILLILANTLQGFAYFVPITWLPTFASELNLTNEKATLALALLNGFAVVSRLTLGFLSDKLNPWLLASITTISASTVTFILWGIFSSTFTGLIAFGIAYGTVASGWSSLFASIIRPIAKDDPLLSTNLLGFLLFTRGLGNVLSTPISTALFQTKNISNSHRADLGFFVGGGKYEGMIVYVGTCFAASAIVAIVALAFEKLRR